MAARAVIERRFLWWFGFFVCHFERQSEISLFLAGEIFLAVEMTGLADLHAATGSKGRTLCCPAVPDMVREWVVIDRGKIGSMGGVLVLFPSSSR